MTPGFTVSRNLEGWSAGREKRNVGRVGKKYKIWYKQQQEKKYKREVTKKIENNIRENLK